MRAQVRTGHRTQGVALFTRMGDRFSTYDVANGLQSLIPTLLTSGCGAPGLQCCCSAPVLSGLSGSGIS